MPYQDKPANIGLGCVTFGREIDQQQSFAMMDYAISCGIIFFDTAAAYQQGASESVIGAWLQSRQPQSNQVLVATKCLPPYSPATIQSSLDQSHQRLSVSVIDVFYLHAWNNSVRDIHVLAQLDELVKEGKVRNLGASNFTDGQLDEIIRLQKDNGLTPFKFVQNNHNLAVSDLTTRLKNICEANKIEIITYSPLGAGFLTGKYTNGVPGDSRFGRIPGHQDIYFTAQALKRCEQLRTIAAETHYSMEHLALAWTLHQPAVSYVLAGGRTTEQLKKAVTARSFFDKEIFDRLDAIK